MASITREHQSTSPAPDGLPAAASTRSDPGSKGPPSDFHPAPPSETAPPTVETAAPQQAATQPDAGGQVIITPPARRASFSQKVVGYAKEIRGTPETKDYGGKIRKGEEPWPPPSHDVDDAQDAGSAPPSSTSPAGQAQVATP